MTLIQLIVVICIVLMLSVGQVLFKLAAMDMKSFNLLAFTQIKIILALLTYAVATVLWIFILRQTPLSIAYPFVSLSFLIVPLLSWSFLGEQYTLNTIIGGFIVLIGLWIANS